MDDKKWIDAYGQEINVGDIVAYGARSGNSGKIELRKVIGLLTKERTRYRSYTHKPMENYFVYLIRVEPYTEIKHVNDFDVTSKPSTIGALDQIIVVTKHFKL